LTSSMVDRLITHSLARLEQPSETDRPAAHFR
jgi:hypothetical protein